MKFSSIFFTASVEIFEVYLQYTPQTYCSNKILTKQKGITNVSSTNKTNFVI